MKFKKLFENKNERIDFIKKLEKERTLKIPWKIGSKELKVTIEKIDNKWSWVVKNNKDEIVYNGNNFNTDKEAITSFDKWVANRIMISKISGNSHYLDKLEGVNK
jgi:hypothetical protein